MDELRRLEHVFLLAEERVARAPRVQQAEPLQAAVRHLRRRVVCGDRAHVAQVGLALCLIGFPIKSQLRRRNSGRKDPGYGF